MAYATTTSRLETLTRDNYDTWCIQAEALLIKNDSWGYVSGEIIQPVDAGEAAIKTWIMNDRKAKADLILAINPSELAQIRGCTTSREVWTKLQSIYASKGPARKATLLKRLTQQKMQINDDLNMHLAQFFDAVDKLQAMDININGDLLSIMLLYSLPSNFENFRCAIESRDNLPDVESLKIKIIEEHNARIQKSSNDDSNAAMFAKNQKSRNFQQRNNSASGSKSSQDAKRYKCGYCRKRGHKEHNCWHKKNMQKDKDNKPNEAHYCHSTKNVKMTKDPDNLWCLDSGCTSHLCSNKNAFVNLHYKSSTLKLANDSETRVLGKGDVNIAIANAGVVTLKDTLYVPDLRSNLVSIAKIMDQGHEINFRKSCAVVTDEYGKTILVAERIGDLFYLRERQERANVISEGTKLKTDVEIWHTRLGHLNARDLSLLAKDGYVNGLRLKTTVNEIKCESCIAGKMSSIPFGKRENFSDDLLELVHMDICGPMRTQSQGGARYFITFIDDYSRVCNVYFLKQKSEAVQKFKDYKNLVENQLGRKIKAIQSDNGGEFVNKEMSNLLRVSGIQQRLTAPHTPQQNGIAERKNRTLVEAARCMQIDANLPPSLWAEAIATANYVKNRCPTKSLPDGITPMERWTHKKPNLSNLRSFGEKAFVLDKSTRKGKFEPKGIPGFFVGYAENSKAYRIWIPEEPKKIRISRDVKFLNEFQSSLFNTHDEESKSSSEVRITRDIIMDASIIHHPIEHVETHVSERNEEDNHGSSREPQFEVAESENEVGTSQDKKRHCGRPKLLRTGKRGRPKKQYHTDIVEEEAENPVENAGTVMTAIEVPLDDALSSEDKEEWFEAICKETKCLVANDTWELVERPENTNVISCRTVLSNKFNPDGSLERRKARIVARGFSQRPGIDFTNTFAPVARLDSFRLLMALSAKLDLQVTQLDITTAYLNGEMDTLVYMEQPMLLEDALKRIIVSEKDEVLIAKSERMLQTLSSGNKVCKLRKALYGLRQAGRQWHTKLSSTLLSLELTPTTSDPCVYVDHHTKGSTFVLIYVDDIVIASNNQKRVDEIKRRLSSEYQVKDLGNIKYCLGIEVEQRENQISIAQSGYIREILKKFKMSDCKPVKSPVAVGTKLERESIAEENEECYPYRELIGALMYIAIGTRPDITHAVAMLSQFNNHNGKAHWQSAKRILRYLKGTIDRKLVYSKDEEGILGYADADWGNCTIDRKSYSGYVFSLSGGAISWSSKKQKIVALSSTEAEYVSLSKTIREAIYLSSFLKEFGLDILSKITIYNDNQSAGKLVENPVFHARTKHVDIKHHFIRQATKIYPIRIKFLPTEEMTADVLTKPLSGAKLENCVRGLGLQDN